MYDTKRLKCFRADGGLESESGLELDFQRVVL